MQNSRFTLRLVLSSNGVCWTLSDLHTEMRKVHPWLFLLLPPLSRKFVMKIIFWCYKWQWRLLAQASATSALWHPFWSSIFPTKHQLYQEAKNKRLNISSSWGINGGTWVDQISAVCRLCSAISFTVVFGMQFQILHLFSSQTRHPAVKVDGD